MFQLVANVTPLFIIFTFDVYNAFVQNSLGYLNVMPVEKISDEKGKKNFSFKGFREKIVENMDDLGRSCEVV